MNKELQFATSALGFASRGHSHSMICTDRFQGNLQGWQKAEDQVLFGDLMMWAWLFLGNPMPKQKVGRGQAL